MRRKYDMGFQEALESAGEKDESLEHENRRLRQELRSADRSVNIERKTATAIARLAAYAIREKIKKGIHGQQIRAANLHLDRFVSAIERRVAI
jgi:hypothetical protein